VETKPKEVEDGEQEVMKDLRQRNQSPAKLLRRQTLMVAKRPHRPKPKRPKRPKRPKMMIRMVASFTIPLSTRIPIAGESRRARRTWLVYFGCIVNSLTCFWVCHASSFSLGRGFEVGSVMMPKEKSKEIIVSWMNFVVACFDIILERWLSACVICA